MNKQYTYIITEEEEEEIIQDIFGDHDDAPSSPKNEKIVWSCGYCDEAVYSKKPKLLEHIAHNHTHEYRFFCDFCDQGFYFDGRRREHENKIHKKIAPQPRKVKEAKFACTMCELKYNCNSHLQDHMVRVHTKDFRFFCDICGKGFYLYSRKLKHIRQKHDPEKTLRRRPQSKMHEQFVNKAAYRDFEKAEEGGVYCPVEGCGKVISRNNLGVHLDTHENHKYVCEYCSKVYTHYPSLERHVKTHQEGPKTYPCDTCNKVLTTLANLVYHKRIHTGEKPAQCEHCGQGFTCTRDLNVHRRRQHQDMPMRYACTICEKSFMIYGRLRQHYATYHPDDQVPDQVEF